MAVGQNDLDELAALGLDASDIDEQKRQRDPVMDELDEDFEIAAATFTTIAHTMQQERAVRLDMEAPLSYVIDMKRSGQ